MAAIFTLEHSREELAASLQAHGSSKLVYDAGQFCSEQLRALTRRQHTLHPHGRWQLETFG